MIGWLLRLFPKQWRQRYGDEYRALLEDCGIGLAVVADVIKHAARAHLELRRGGLKQLGAAVTFAVAEWVAFVRGYSDNIFWLPTSTNSTLLLGAAVATLIVAIAPAGRSVKAFATRHASSAR